MEEVSGATLVEVAGRIRRHEVSAGEVTASLLARIEEVDSRLGSFETLMADRAIADADRADAELTAGGPRGPLHGVPVAVKDLCDTAGVRTASGTVVLGERIPAKDATVVRRLRAAGAVVIGKTKTSEGAFATHHPSVSPPLNPWDERFWSGVSSSGSGVAVAARLCFGAIGTDTGGSIRFPCHANGVAGLKPTYGRVSRHGVFPLAASLDHVGPIARTAADLGLLLGVIAGYDPLDPTSLRDPLERPASVADCAGGLRVGIDRGYVSDGSSDETIAMVEAVLEALGELGAEPREVELPPLRELYEGWVPACSVETAIAHSEYFADRPGDYGEALRGLVEAGQALAGTDLARLAARRETVRGQMRRVFSEVDVLVVPVLGHGTPTLAELDGILADPDLTNGLLRFTAAFNMIGVPTLTLSGGRTTAGMPMGFQLVGPWLSDASLCELGVRYQQITDWHRAEPPLSRPPAAVAGH